MEAPRETIFYSSIRSFFKSFFVIIGIFCAFIPVFLILTATSTEKDTGNKNIVTYLPDDTGSQHILSISSPAILRMNINGIIGKDLMTQAAIKSQLLESREGVLKNNRVKGIFIHINSPGGGVTDCDGIYRLLVEYKKLYKVPIYAYVDGLCASAAMYIACACDKVYTSPMSIVGSVGVIFGPFFNINDTLNKVGVLTETLTKGKDKDTFSPFKKWSENEGAMIEPIIQFMYNRFLSIVSTARPKLTMDKLKNEYGAHVFDSQKAYELGYTDGWNLEYNAALKELTKAANIKADEKYQLIELKPKRAWLTEILQGASSLMKGKIKHEIQIGPENPDTFSFIYDPASCPTK